MIHLSRRELLDFAELVVLCNTPSALYGGLRAHQAVRRMASLVDETLLLQAYDKVTARGRRTEVELGLAYAFLLSLLVHDHGTPASLDASRLLWGDSFRELARLKESATSSVTVTGGSPALIESTTSLTATSEFPAAPSTQPNPWIIAP